MIRTVLIYGALLAIGALGIEWLEFQYFVRTNPAEIWIGLIALLFLVLGLWVGARIFGAKPPADFAPNTKAQETLRISDREIEVLVLMAAGASNKDIANRLTVSPNTVKTHIANLFTKLEVRRRTEAIVRARELGIIP